MLKPHWLTELGAQDGEAPKRSWTLSIIVLYVLLLVVDISCSTALCMLLLNRAGSFLPLYIQYMCKNRNQYCLRSHSVLETNRIGQKKKKLLKKLPLILGIICRNCTDIASQVYYFTFNNSTVLLCLQVIYTNIPTYIYLNYLLHSCYNVQQTICK